ncbi:MAG: carboxypeptidase regulatory-like domain-containing protein, partial [Deltaproteobacteria bacterium]|nr:carboxypeptidase regulatory-like domain-containing protein [Deltaproteobacteria bacterium]
DQRGAAIKRARVCARGYAAELPDDLVREPTCTTAGDDGAYAIEGLFPGRYFASAAAPTYQSAAWSDVRDEPRPIVLRAGQRRTDIDLVLRDGGVELAGIVSDLTGGPIEKARVWVDGGVLVETDAKGEWSLWVKPGTNLVTATADGYAPSTDDIDVPKSKSPAVRMEIVLTPESSIAGIVVDAASNEPIAGARVIVGHEWEWEAGETTFTDERGAFRVSRLIPKRYVVVARTSAGFGRTEGSVLVGLAQHVEGIVVKVFPAFRIDGRVVVTSTKQDCERGSVSLQNRAAARFFDLVRGTDGTHFGEGVLPGKYDVTVYCPGTLTKETYPPIEIVDRDATGLVWDVDTGATLRGRVTTTSGEPIRDATVSAAREAKARDKFSGGGGSTTADGRYEITGLRGGSYKLTASIERDIVARETIALELADGAVVERDVVLTPEAVGAIAGTVTDADGRPVAEVEVEASGIGVRGSPRGERSGPAGTFSIPAVRPGEYRLTARTQQVVLRKAGTTDDTNQGERVTVRAGQTSTVRIVVESQGGAISGTVVDAAGQPVADAFVSAARESDAAGATNSGAYRTRWNWNERPVLTTTDGAFALSKLAPGNYTIRAYRRGGGEAIAEHVATGGTAKLTIRATGSIAGKVTHVGGEVPTDFAISIRDFTSGYRRREQFFRSDGRYALADLPKGTYVVSAEALGGLVQMEVILGEGEARTGVDLALEGFVTLTGRVVDLVTTAPVTGVSVVARRVRGGGMYPVVEGKEHVSDEAGRFTVRNAPQGQVLISGWGGDDNNYAGVQAYRTIRGTGTIDIGDVTMLKHRIKGGEPAGELGLKFAEQSLDTPPDKRERRISYVDPKGPAASSGIEVGDIVVSIDGIDVRGENAGRAHTLLQAPPGTKLALGLLRNTTATIILAIP